MIFPVCRVAASTGLIRKMGGGGLLGSRCIARCLSTPSTPMLLFIYYFSFPSIFENYSVRGAAGFENMFNIHHYRVLVHEQGSMGLSNKLRKVIAQI